MTRVTIIGAGFSGIGLAVKLLQQGYEPIILERSGDVGGVWRDNTYPGAACDVPSHLYSFSFAPFGGWSRRFAPQQEIHAYLRRVATDFGVLPLVRFHQEVQRARYDEGSCTWTLELADGSTHETDVLVAACGQLSRPAIPPGLEGFAGPAFHSAHWDHEWDPTGKRVVVVGTGASAIQFVPELVKKAAHVTVLQRSAPYVIKKPDRPYNKAVGLRALRADRTRLYLGHEVRSVGFNTEPRLLRAYELAFRRYLRRQVKDPSLRARLTPTDPMGCKRVLQSNEWYPALTQPHVKVVTSPVVSVEPHAVVTADGRRREADALIYGTGFTATELLLPMQVLGPAGTLQDAWKDGAEAYLGSAVAGFPNLFLMYGPNTNLGHNSIILMLESQFAWITAAIRTVASGGSVEVRPEVQSAYNSWLQQKLGKTVFAGGCRSWYLTADGRNTQNWPGTTAAFRWRTRRLDLADVTVRAPARVLV